ncbi:hypothetical protein HMPREF1531_02526 [Propionibacterium sp. oral taxon 192 str. F0372]|uniref:MFS transporter n=1 Tax=Propionibacterium sp. oral taxon 192 TaxID=671222 RepID=UPI000354293D|nr:MFS transporter [Propionibacterium sp. oral taxon 192]EPH00414.1 hypothetical protein HMPREF1531_02526 [Propionibacterium sp. oral taxon 192 str. F0372]
MTHVLSTRAQRLDRLRFGREHSRLLIGSGVGWALDAMDVGLISYVMTALSVEWQLDNAELGMIGSVGFVGMMVGASAGGLAADRIGRRAVFALTLLVYGLATGLAAFSTGVTMLLVLRGVVGLGLGAELPVAATLVSEYAPSRIRGRVVVWLESFWALGWILAAALGYFLVPKTAGGWSGWRWALLVGVVPAFYAAVVRHGLPESVRFLESKGRQRQAELAVRRFERGSGVEPSYDLDVAVAETPTSVEDSNGSVRTTSLLGPEHRRSTVGLWLVWFFVNLSYYGAFTWMPTLLLRQGHDLVRSFGYTLVITVAQLPGYAVAAWLIEVWGRRATLACFLTGSGVSALFFGMQDSTTGIIAFGCLLSFFNLGAWGALYAIGPEIYPTALRGAGTGAASAVGRVAAIVAPLLVPVLLVGGNPLVFAVFAVSFLIAAVSALLLPERRHLEMIE